MRRALLAAAVIIAVGLAAAAPAGAEHLRVGDPAADVQHKRVLNMTDVTLFNGNRAVRVVVGFADSDRSGTIDVDVRARHAGLMNVQARHRAGAAGVEWARLYVGRERVRCAGFEVRWPIRRNLVTIWVPAACRHHGNYGAVRFRSRAWGVNPRVLVDTAPNPPGCP